MGGFIEHVKNSTNGFERVHDSYGWIHEVMRGFWNWKTALKWL